METVTFVSTPAPSSSSTQPAATVGSKKNKSRASKDDALVPPAAKAPTKASRKGERIAFELDDVLRKYSPEQFKTCKAYDVGGVNILNKKPVDSRTALDKIKRRRETHNRVERRRRDCINQLIEELTSLLPRDDDDSQSKCHRVNVLRTAVAHIQTLTQQNEDLARKLGELQASTPTLAPAIITTPPRMHYDDRNQWTDSSTHIPHNLSCAPTAGSRPTSPSLPSLNDMSTTLPSIPTIIEPSESIPSSSSSYGSQSNTVPGTHPKRLNRQTVPRLQLVPPPFHHRRSSSGGVLSPPSHYGQDSQSSPGSIYSGYSPTWSSSSSSLGPFSNSPSGPLSSYSGTSPRSPGYPWPPSPHSPYDPSINSTPTSPASHSQFHIQTHSPHYNDWNAADYRVDVDDRNRDSNTGHRAPHTTFTPYERNWEAGQGTSIPY